MTEIPQKTKQNTSRLRKSFFSRFFKGISFLIILFVVITLLRLIYSIIGFQFIYSEGERAGLIIKLSEKGLIWKTWEGEAALYQGGIATTYIWTFTIDNADPHKQEILNKVQMAFQTGRPVKLLYRETLGTPPWRGSSTYFVKDVVFVEPSQQ